MTRQKFKQLDIAQGGSDWILVAIQILLWGQYFLLLSVC